MEHPGCRQSVGAVVDEGVLHSNWLPPYQAMKNSIEYAKPTIMPVTSRILAMFSR